MKVFLTGASGFVGGHLAKRLVADGHSVIAAVRGRSDTSRIPPECSVVTVDFSSEADLSQHLKGIEAVFHVAGAVKAASSEEFDRINAGITATLLNAVSAVCPESLFVLVSSQAAAGPLGQGPISSYGRSKLLAEQAVSGFRRHVIVRPPAVLGPGDTETEPLFQWALRGITVVPGDRDAKFCLISVFDLVDFMCMLLHLPEAEGKILQPSHPEPVTWNSFHKSLESAIGRKILKVSLPPFLIHTAAFFSEIISAVTGTRSIFDRNKARELTSSWSCRQKEVEEITGWKPQRRPLVHLTNNSITHW